MTGQTLIAKMLPANAKRALVRLLQAVDHRGLPGVLMWLTKKVWQRIASRYGKIERSLYVRFSGLLRYAYLRLMLSKSALLQEINQLPSSCGLTLLARSFSVDYYRGAAQLPQDTSSFAAFKHLVSHGLANGLQPNPMYDAGYVAHQQNLSDPVPFAQWLASSELRKLKPSVLFDNQFYRQKSSRQHFDEYANYCHFVSVGVWADRSPCSMFEPDWYKKRYSLNLRREPAFYHYLTNAGQNLPNADFPMQVTQAEELVPANLHKTLLQLETGQMDVAALPFSAAASSNANPETNKAAIQDAIFNDPMVFIKAHLRVKLAPMKVKNIVAIPRCGIGGAAVVAGKLCAALKQLYPQQGVLLLRTDDSLFMRPDWFNATDYHFDLSCFLHHLSDTQKQSLFEYVIRQSQCQRLFNVNSTLVWDWMRGLSASAEPQPYLYAYAFCYEVTYLGEKAGYPVSHIPECMESISGLLLDNQYLKNDLHEANQWSDNLAQKAHVLYTPFDEISHAGKLWSVPQRATSERRKVFWAGRFDRQKRLDIVQRIAQNNPQWDFMIWGKAMLGAEPDQSKMPSNMFFNGLFEHIDDLPLSECDAWLYTSQWDGIPTLLIDLGLRAVPIVGSRVWGTSEVLTDQTAWPVDDILNPSAYQTGLKRFIDNPQIAQEAGRACRELICDNHSSENYLASLKQALASEEQ